MSATGRYASTYPVHSPNTAWLYVEPLRLAETAGYRVFLVTVVIQAKLIISALYCVIT